MGAEMLFGLGASIGSGMFNNAMSYGMSSAARQENYYFGERAAENADRRTRALYNDLQSPSALLQQYQQAGLSPSLMFSGSGGAGAQPSSGAQGSGAAGINPTSYGVDLGGLAMQQAQVDLMKAEANKANSEAELNNNYRGREIEANIAEKLAAAGVDNAQEELIRLQTKIQDALAAPTIDKMYEELNQVRLQNQEWIYKIMSAEAQAQVDLATVKDRIQNVKLQNQELEAKIDLYLEQTKLTQDERKLVKAKIFQIGEEVAQGWINLAIEGSRAQSYDKYVENLGKYQDEQIRLGKERLKHDISLDWAKYGLDCGKFLQSVYEFNVNNLTDKLLHILPSGDAVVKGATGSKGLKGIK